MRGLRVLKTMFVGGASVVALTGAAHARVYDIPDGDLATALSVYIKQSNTEIVYADDVVRGHRSRGAKGDYTETAALTQLLKGTGLKAQTMTSSNAIEIVPQAPAAEEVQVAQANKPAVPLPPQQTGLETVVVTAQKKTENIQTVPIAVTALSQQQLTERQIAGGPDLVKEVPNLTFSKTNFTGYNLEIRGIGTQAISVTTDPAVAVAFNDTPFIRNHFFEQEFFDVDNLEVLRGPQGTLYGRNATGGVVNIKSALPTDQYEAMVSADIGNYSNRRYEAMLNLPIVGDTLDIRIAGEWTKRDGYTEDTTLNSSIDGRDLWSGRITIGWKPTSDIQTYLIWEHFNEDDDRLRSGKQLCKTAPIPSSVGGTAVPTQSYNVGAYDDIADYLSQGCEDTSLYSPSAYEVPNGYSLTYYAPLNSIDPATRPGFDIYGETTQSTNLRDIQSAILPQYVAKNDTVEYNVDWNISPALAFTSQTGFNQDYLWSTEDYDRFDSAPGAFVYPTSDGITIPDPAAGHNGVPADSGIFCDPQLGCSDRLVLQDLATERSWQASQEFRLASNFSGPLNFSAGANYLHYETEEDYYVFLNSITSVMAAEDGTGATTAGPWVPGVSTDAKCMIGSYRYTNYSNPPTDFLEFPGFGGGCGYVDPNSIKSVNNEGHNYFLSQNPYVLNSYALFGESYYNFTPDLKLTAGLRWTDDQKHFDVIPSQLLIPGYGYPETGQVNQSWQRFTGRSVLDWTPQLDFTDQTLFYASYAHGYKAGGANPPGAYYATINAIDNTGTVVAMPIHPLTFKPEYIEAFELGTKNTLLGGSLTMNGDLFYYNYSNYQISEIVDRTAINNNYNAHMEGAEFEANWEPLPGLKLSLAQGFENTGLAGGDKSIDLMDRTAGNPNWIVVKPYVTTSSNCILPTYVVAAAIQQGNIGVTLCSTAYGAGLDPITGLPYTQDPTSHATDYRQPPVGYQGFDPSTAPNNGEGFYKNLAGNQLPNAPHFTTSLTGEYTMPVSDDWAATLHADFYWQSQQWARVFEDPIDKLHGYSTTNLSLILNSANGWQVMAYVKNVFDVTAITGTFLNSDDTGLTTNVFLTDPRLYGIRVTKHLDENDGFWGSDYNGKDFFTGLFSDTDNGRPPLWIELGGQLAQLDDGQQKLALPFTPNYTQSGNKSPLQTEDPLRLSLEEDAKLTFQPDGSDWVFSGVVQFGRSKSAVHQHLQTNNKPVSQDWSFYGLSGMNSLYPSQHVKFADTQTTKSASHAIVDFLIGKDVGLGMFGMDGSSVVSGGVRVAQFISKTNINLHADPDLHYPSAPITSFAQKYSFIHAPIRFHDYAQSASNKESFHGLGPKLDWNASTAVAGDQTNGQLNFDWGANFAVLFGRQKSKGQHQTAVKSYYLNDWQYGFATHVTAHGKKIRNGQFENAAISCRNLPVDCPPTAQHTNAAVRHNRSRMVAVPNIGAFAGLSMKYNNAKISFGYRADEFFGAMDGGIDQRKTYNQGFFGPYVNISIGLGG